MALDTQWFDELEARIPHGQVRTRFAPSPTGYMHVGNLRTALYTYLIARHMDEPRALFRIAERIAQRPDPLEPRLDAEQQAVVDLLQRFLIRHPLFPLGKFRCMEVCVISTVRPLQKGV